jgi:SAM-dependent methyltransferase
MADPGFGRLNMQMSKNESPVPVENFRQLSRYYREALYPGEHQLISEVIERFDRSSCAELVKFVDANNEKLAVPWELRRVWRLAKLSADEKAKHYVNYAADAMEAGRRDVELLRSFLDREGLMQNSRGARILDLGTGRGNFLVAAQGQPAFSAWQFEGTDMDMASLLINLKMNEELGHRNFKLACSYGENLPYEDGAFNVIASFQTLEHVGNSERQTAFVSEACRCLAAGGIAVFTFPNRFDVLRPEPHVYIRFLGFVPQCLKDRVSMAFRGMPSSDIYPPDIITLRRGLKRIKGVTFSLHSTSELSPSAWKRTLAKSSVFRMFGPWNVLVGRKQP